MVITRAVFWRAARDCARENDKVSVDSNRSHNIQRTNGWRRQDAGSSAAQFLPVAALQVRKGATGGNRQRWIFPKICLRWGAGASAGSRTLITGVISSFQQANSPHSKFRIKKHGNGSSAHVGHSRTGTHGSPLGLFSALHLPGDVRAAGKTWDSSPPPVLPPTSMVHKFGKSKNETSTNETFLVNK